MHWDWQMNLDAEQIAGILMVADLKQHVQERTHKHGHVLDLAIIRDDNSFNKDVSVLFLSCLIISLLAMMHLYRTICLI